MDEVLTETKTKRGPGRPRKQAVTPDESVSGESPAYAPAQARETELLPAMPAVKQALPVLPLTDTDIDMVDRKGAAKMLGKSVMTIQWLEVNDPDFPAAFPLGKNNFYFLTNDLRAYVLKKAAQANAQKQARMQGTAK